MEILNKGLTQLPIALQETIKRLIASGDEFSKARKETLDTFVKLISGSSRDEVNLIFVCTHNSRRSHVTMIWAQLAAWLYGKEKLQTFSGGTEVTAFNARAIAALQRAGFRVDIPATENPRVNVMLGKEFSKLTCFSKRYDDDANPKTNYIAVMTCAHADDNCPYLPGADHRFPLRYVDPGHADGTPHEDSAYDQLVEQVGKEMLYVFGSV